MGSDQNVVDTRRLHAEYTEESGGRISAASFGCVVHSVFIYVTKIGVYHNSEKTRAYVGLRRVEQENIVPVTINSIRQVAITHGYQLLHKQDGLLLCKVTEEFCNGQRLSKEILYDYEQTKTITVTVGHISVHDQSIPKVCNSLNVLKYILRHVAEAKICKGFPSSDISKSDLKNVTLEIWDFVGRETETVYRTNKCFGFISRSNRNERCLKCKEKKRYSAESRQTTHSEHGYVKVTDVSLGLKRLHESTAREHQTCADPSVSSQHSLRSDTLPGAEPSDDSDVSSDDGLNSDDDPTYTPSKSKKVRISDASSIRLQTMERVEEAISLLPDPLKNNESFVQLLRGQALNSIQPDKHLRRWDTGYWQLNICD